MRPAGTRLSGTPCQGTLVPCLCGGKPPDRCGDDVRYSCQNQVITYTEQSKAAIKLFGTAQAAHSISSGFCGTWKLGFGLLGLLPNEDTAGYNIRSK